MRRPRFVLPTVLALVTSGVLLSGPGAVASPPLEPRDCSAVTRADGAIDVTWRSPASGGNAVIDYRVRERGRVVPVVIAPTWARSVVWTVPLRGKAPAVLTVRARNDAGASDPCSAVVRPYTGERAWSRAGLPRWQ